MCVCVCVVPVCVFVFGDLIVVSMQKRMGEKRDPLFSDTYWSGCLCVWAHVYEHVYEHLYTRNLWNPGVKSIPLSEQCVCVWVCVYVCVCGGW